MVCKPLKNVLPDNRRRRTVRLLVCSLWVAALILWAAGWMYLHRDEGVGEISENAFQEPPTAVPGSPAALETLAGLEFVRCDPEHDFRPLAAISCESLWTENGQLGVFQTALHKELTLDKPRLRLYEYSNTVAATGDKDRNLAAGASHAASAPDFTALITDAFTATWSGVMAKMNTDPVIDLSNTTRVFFRDLDCSRHRDGVETLRLQCRRAQLSWRKPDVLDLRGHVCIRTADGRQMECNQARWYFSQQLFRIEGRYWFNDNGNTREGSGGTWDYALNPANTTSQTIAATAAATTISTSSSSLPTLRGKALNKGEQP